MKFSLVIPCYNEAENLPLLIERCKSFNDYPDVEIIFVDNGSTDNSADILSTQLKQYKNFRSIKVDNNLGYGVGILAGLASSKADILGWTHADMQTDPMDALIGLKLMKNLKCPSFVKGVRKGRPVADIFFTMGMSAFETILLQKPLWDINAQPTLFHRSFFETWSNPPHDFSLDLYAYYQANLAGLNIQRFPVLFGDRAHGISHWNINWSSKLKFIQRTVKFSLNLRGWIKP